MKLNYYLFALLFISISCTKKEAVLKKSDNKFYDKAYEFLEKKEKDSAFIYFNLAKNAFLKDNDSARTGNCIVNMAVIQAENGDYFGSQETSLDAIQYLNVHEEKLHPVIYSNYNNLGIVTKNLKEYKRAIGFFDDAIKYSTSPIEITTCLNNKANCFRHLKKYDKAITIYKAVFKNIDPQNDKKGYARVVDNLAYVKFLQNPAYQAETEMNLALQIREKENDLWGQNASQAHLSDYFSEKNAAKSLFHAQQMYEIAKKIDSPDDEIEALQKLVKLENLENSKKYYSLYVSLNDSLTTVRNKAKNQFALIQYESEKNRVDFLDAKAQNIEKSYQVFKRNIALGISLLVLILAVFWYQKRKKRLQQEKDFEVKSTVLKYSKKVHDVVSNGIYQVMSEIENSSELDKNGLLNKLEVVYEKSRDISYENLTGNPAIDFKLQISNLVKSFSSKSVKPIMIGNEEELWADIPQNLKNEISVILQELLVNTKKHSKAKKIFLKFEIIANHLQIDYSDDGIGLGKTIQKKNGLQNVETRIFSQKGNLIFDEIIEKGTKITISFPLKNG
ncbi:tetratricopeptide repeat-containing sensor histidine kinase [Kaistella sp.]|uniref:tetratricopeptide repeat-containing sensor histidine kinase n=1 Tax=Kaistella sp. TaxID=2782235 RepID=UPI003C45A7DF